MLEKEITRLDVATKNTINIKNKINDKLSDFGNFKINKFSELPSVLGNAIKTSYKKVAVIDVDFNIAQINSNLEQTIPMSLSFKPERIILKFMSKYTRTNSSVNGANRDDNRYLYVDSGYQALKYATIYITSYDATKVNFKQKFSWSDAYGTRKAKVYQIIALG